jgi:hypothetical protein
MRGKLLVERRELISLMTKFGADGNKNPGIFRFLGVARSGEGERE